MLLVDTCVWSLAFRRDRPSDDATVEHLRRSLEGADDVVVTGLILQELLQGVRGPSQREVLIDRLSALRSITPDRQDHIGAADIRNRCRRAGVQLGTVDALIVSISVRHDLTLLTVDADFAHAAQIVPLHLWTP